MSRFGADREPVPRCSACRAEIWFGLTEKGRRMPLDPQPAEDGNVVVVDLEGRMETDVVNLGRARAQRTESASDGSLPHVRTLRQGEHVADGLPRYRSHFSTCSDAGRFRRPKAAQGASAGPGRAKGGGDG